MLALKKDGQVISTHHDGGVVDLPNGDRVMPAYAGWENDDGFRLEAYTPPPAPEPELTVDEYKAAIVTHLDAVAQSRLYDSAVSISTYVTSTNPQWAAEAAAFIAWRDAVWVYAYTELDKVMTAQREQPAVAELLAELPVMVWPA